MRLFLIIFLLFQSINVFVIPQSQLMAEKNINENEVVLLGEVVYLGERAVNLSTAIHIERQTVVFRVIEVFKGEMDVEYVKVALPVSDATNGLSTERYKRGNKFILYLNNKECKNNCVDLTSDWEFNVKPEFQKFENFPCFFEDSKSLVETNDEKTEKVKSAYKNITNKN